MTTHEERLEGEPERDHDVGAHPEDERRAGHLGFVAHEIRNPLSTALWTAELLARMTPADRGGARGDKLSGMCLRSLARVRQLVEDHFLCERLDAGGLALRIERVDVAEALEAVIGKRGDAGPVNVHAAAGLFVDADRGFLERALDGLVAVAGEERTPVEITLTAEGDEIGVAIAGRPADAAALADPAKGSPSDPAGRALALPVARRIIHALGGALVAAEGRWFLSLPRARAYTARPEPAARP
jgi:signal transduction histidine kinase